jgi:hypothetical protein
VLLVAIKPITGPLKLLERPFNFRIRVA